jgi:two-component system, cell cycle sensor histidine kinase and response regulator CckA
MPTVLVVDDEPGICMLISQILEQNGFSVLVAHNGADAILISQSHQSEIGLVITDVRMPKVDGPTFVRGLFADAPEIPVLFMSDHCDPSDLDQFETSEFLAKPFSVAKLMEVVRTMLPEPDLHLVN